MILGQPNSVMPKSTQTCYVVVCIIASIVSWSWLIIEIRSDDFDGLFWLALILPVYHALDATRALIREYRHRIKPIRYARA
jgi:hypothetical protein